MISPAEQSAQKIEVQAVQMRDCPPCSLPGHIALPDNATWRVGVLTDGRVEKGVCQPWGLRAQGANPRKNAQPRCA